MMIKYRTEAAYGSGVRNIINVMSYEIYELLNMDILEYVLEHYSLGNDIESKINSVLHYYCSHEHLDGFSEHDIVELCNHIIKRINSEKNKDLKYALWLADKDAVKKYYNGEDENIDEYDTSDVVLSDLGCDGILYAYENIPKKLNN